ncbi:MAG: hypothetical protein HY688_03140 [Chloroflexi bacterium]|nr:hypothetical protein [Chloroflexota bacterium]
MERDKIEAVEVATGQGHGCECACGGTLCGAQAIELVGFTPLQGKPSPDPVRS